MGRFTHTQPDRHPLLSSSYHYYGQCVPFSFRGPIFFRWNCILCNRPYRRSNLILAFSPANSARGSHFCNPGLAMSVPWPSSKVTTPNGLQKPKNVHRSVRLMGSALMGALQGPDRYYGLQLVGAILRYEARDTVIFYVNGRSSCHVCISILF